MSIVFALTFYNWTAVEGRFSSLLTYYTILSPLHYMTFTVQKTSLRKNIAFHNDLKSCLLQKRKNNLYQAQTSSKTQLNNSNRDRNSML